MGCKMIGMVLAMVLVVSICDGAMGDDVLGCTSVLKGMPSCINFVTGNSSKPSDSCCSQIVEVVQSQPQCLCEALTGFGLSHGININRTLALTLPGACNVQTPIVNKCTGAFDPVGSPEGSISEQDLLPKSPSESDSPSGSGSKTGGSKSNGNKSRAPIHLLAFVLFVVSWTFTVASF